MTLLIVGRYHEVEDEGSLMQYLVHCVVVLFANVHVMLLTYMRYR
jgi:hypothetical protein